MTGDITERLRTSRRIVVIKLRYVGDCIWTLPFLENLKRNLPDATITVVANKGTDAFFHHNDYVDQVLPYPNREVKKGGVAGARAFLRFVAELRRLKADTAIDLTDSDKAMAVALLSGASTRIGYRYSHAQGLRHRFLNHVLPFVEAEHWVSFNFHFLERLGLTVFDRAIHNRTPESAFASLRLKCPSLFMPDSRKRILVHPGARVALRQWGSGKFAELCDLLAPDYRVVLTAGPDEKALLDEVVATMRTTPEFSSAELDLHEFAALAELSDLFVGNDSGPIHIAATKTFTVGIYGPNCDYFAGPWTTRKHIFEDATLACRTNCSHNDCTHPAFHACMTCTTPEQVAHKVREVLASPAGERRGE